MRLFHNFMKIFAHVTKVHFYIYKYPDFVFNTYNQVGFVQFLPLYVNSLIQVDLANRHMFSEEIIRQSLLRKR